MVRYLATVFCYGTNMGPSQAARSLIGLDRRQIEMLRSRDVRRKRTPTVSPRRTPIAILMRPTCRIQQLPP